MQLQQRKNKRRRPSSHKPASPPKEEQKKSSASSPNKRERKTPSPPKRYPLDNDNDYSSSESEGDWSDTSDTDSESDSDSTGTKRSKLQPDLAEFFKAPPKASSPPKATEPIQPVRISRREGALSMKKVEGSLLLDVHGRPTNTGIAYGRSIDEYILFCEAYYKGTQQEYRYVVSPESVHKSLIWTASRPKGKGGRREGWEKGSVVQTFGLDLSNSIFKEIQAVATGGTSERTFDRSNNLLKHIEPKCGGICIQSLDQAHHAVPQLWEEQVDLGCNNYTKGQLFGNWLERLKTYVGGRKDRIKRATFAEEIDKDSASLGASKHVKLLEDYLYNRGINCCQERSVFAPLRDRMLSLFPTKSLLRGETFSQSELSDLLHFDVEGEDDTSPLMVLILQFTLGESNKQGGEMYGRATRHKDVRYCAIGAVALYLAYRFYYTGEMGGEGAPDSNDNSTWSQIKSLIESISTDNEKCMSDKTYSALIKTACKALGIPPKHWVHIGRVLGVRGAGGDRMTPEDVKITGDWDSHVVDKCYTARIPMTAIRQRAGSLRHNQLYHNVRTLCLPSDKLTPMVSPWLTKARGRFMGGDHGGRLTAKEFFALMGMCAIVVLQDAAFTRLKYAKRWTRSAYRQLPVFNAPATKLLFDQFCTGMGQTMDETKAPHEATLETVVPAIATQLTAVTALLKANCRSNPAGFDSMGEDLMNGFMQSNRSIVQVLEGAANIARQSSPQSNRRANPPNPPNPPTPPLTSEGSDVEPIRLAESKRFGGDGYDLPPVTCAKDVYDCWHGEGRFGDIPVGGGIKELEDDKLSKRRWRSHYSPPNQRMSLRYKSVALLLTEEERVCNDIEAFWKGMNGLFKKVTPFEKLLERRESGRGGNQ